MRDPTSLLASHPIPWPSLNLTTAQACESVIRAKFDLGRDLRHGADERARSNPGEAGVRRRGLLRTVTDERSPDVVTMSTHPRPSLFLRVRPKAWTRRSDSRCRTERTRVSYGRDEHAFTTIFEGNSQCGCCFSVRPSTPPRNSTQLRAGVTPATRVGPRAAPIPQANPNQQLRGIPPISPIGIPDQPFCAVSGICDDLRRPLPQGRPPAFTSGKAACVANEEVLEPQ